MMLKHKWVLFVLMVAVCLLGEGKVDGAVSGKPNVIVIFIDDMGYGDLGVYGHKKHRTPELDRMAKEGMKFDDFYVASSVCSPSRAALMTGCYPKRIDMDMCDLNSCVLRPNARKGLNPSEYTMAEMFKDVGYKTKCVGKWHLGDHPDFMPTKQGFDEFYGIPYSNDMHQKKMPLPLLRGEEVIEAPVKQGTITRRYTEEAVKFIKGAKGQPFFLYLPHAMVHVPLYAGKNFRGKSANGKYGDAVEEIDWSTGVILKTLREQGIADHTLVIFTSDNGAKKQYGGSNGVLRGEKGQADEGGQRVPCLMWWPGKIPAGGVNKEACGAIDLLPTLAKLVGGELVKGREIDGKDIWGLMSGKAGVKSPHEAMFYYQMNQLQCVRSGKWKLHLPLRDKRRNWGKGTGPVGASLYDMEKDMGERVDVASGNPAVVKRLMGYARKMRGELGGIGVDGPGFRKAGWVDKASPRLMKK